jgi:putative phosphonate catabolism associated alcohol dehydrogenase
MDIRRLTMPDLPRYAKAAVMTEPGKDLEIIEYPLPEVETGCILVKITCCTICGSDLHTWQGRRKSPLPIILGHEIVGTIVEMGRGVTHDSSDQPLRLGDRITWTIMDNCGKCYHCREKGLMMKCRNLKKYGHDSCAEAPHFVGGFAEYCLISPGTCVIRLPDSLADTVAAPANCTLSTAVAGWEAIGILPFENVLIQGAGALGIYAAALAAHYGCNRVIVTDIDEARLAFVRNFGATDTINTSGMEDDEIIRAISDLTGGIGVDAAMEAAGVPSIIPLGLGCLRIGGRYVGVGTVFPGADFTIDASKIVFRMLTIKGIHNYDTRHLQMGIDLLTKVSEKYPFSSIVSHSVSLEDINDGLKLALSGEAIRVAVLP